MQTAGASPGFSNVQISEVDLPNITNRANVSMPMSDMHCHVGFVANPVLFAKDAEQAHARVLAVSVEPDEYQRLRKTLPDGVLCLALGLHPWWISGEQEALDAQLMQFDGLFPAVRYVGEVGLDYSPRRVVTKEHQLQAFRHIMQVCFSGTTNTNAADARLGADRMPTASLKAASQEMPLTSQTLLARPVKVVSIHCVRAYDDALSILEECIESRVVTCDANSSACAEASMPTCIFHWFSGSSDQLQRAIALGCFFSVSERMLSFKRGRAYAKAIPENRLLLETDAPYVSDPELRTPSINFHFSQVEEELRRTLACLADIRGVDLARLAAVINETANSLL